MTNASTGAAGKNTRAPIVEMDRGSEQHGIGGGSWYRVGFASWRPRAARSTSAGTRIRKRTAIPGPGTVLAIIPRVNGRRLRRMLHHHVERAVITPTNHSVPPAHRK